MFCPICGKENDEGNKFCIKCGSPLEQLSNIDSLTQNVQPIPTGQPITSTPYQQQTTQKTPSTSSTRTINISVPDPGKINIWPPFVGYGTRRRHIGWVLDGKGEYSEQLLEEVNARFSDRKIPDTEISRQVLTAKGVSVEERPYFILKKHLVSMALNITEYGRDLFVSLASYIKPPISNFRKILVIAMLAYQGFMMLIYPIMLNGAFEKAIGSVGLFGSSGGSPEQLLSLLCIFGPLGAVNQILLIILLIYSGYKWLTEKDFWAALRVEPNEFNEDDLMALEKAVEQTVRQSMDQIATQEGFDLEWPDPSYSTSDRRLI